MRFTMQSVMVRTEGKKGYHGRRDHVVRTRGGDARPRSGHIMWASWP
jgi:hypothetical protein